MPDAIRAFVAVELPQDVKAAIAAVTRQLSAGPHARTVKWVDPAQMHITVKFLGDTDRARLPAVQQALETVAPRHAPFALKLAGLGTFPGGTRVRVVWIGLVEGAEPLVALTNDVESALNALGFKPERHDPSPHVTLGRVRDWASATERQAIANALRAVTVPEFPAARIDHLTMMQSHLSPQGARYSPLQTTTLRSA